MVFLVAQCPACGLWGVRELRKDLEKPFRCRSCNKSVKIKQKRVFGLAIKDAGFFESPKKASDKCRELNLKRAGLVP